jgi:hypothetical protein
MLAAQHVPLRPPSAPALPACRAALEVRAHQREMPSGTERVIRSSGAAMTAI